MWKSGFTSHSKNASIFRVEKNAEDAVATPDSTVHYQP
jgi:hypothetical protein